MSSFNHVRVFNCAAVNKIIIQCNAQHIYTMIVRQDVLITLLLFIFSDKPVFQTRESGYIGDDRETSTSVTTSAGDASNVM